MQFHRLLAGVFLLTCLPSVASAACLDQATASRGYKFQDSAGTVGEIKFKGTDQSVLLQSSGSETRQEFASSGQVLMETSTTTNGNPASHQIYMYTTVPDLLDAVGKTTEYFATVHTLAPGKPDVLSYFYGNRKIVEAERVTIGECSYDTFVLQGETVGMGVIMQKSIARLNWSPILARYVKSATTTYRPPIKDPVVVNWTVVRVGF
jgi:hypothetical protein